MAQISLPNTIIRPIELAIDDTIHFADTPSVSIPTLQNDVVKSQCFMVQSPVENQHV